MPCSHKEARDAFHEFLQTQYPTGMPWNEVFRFYAAHSEAGKRVRTRRQKRFCEDFPHWFRWDDDARTTTARPRRTRWGTKEESSLKFYDETLRDDRLLRRSCEDRHVFDREVGLWKERERLAGRQHPCLPPSKIAFCLRMADLVRATDADEKIIAWNDAPPSSDRNARIREVATRVREFRAELESNRGGIVVSPAVATLESAADSGVVRVGSRAECVVAIENRTRDCGFACRVRAELARRRGIVVEMSGSSSMRVDLAPGSTIKVTISTVPKSMGVLKSIVAFDFEPCAIEGGSVVAAMEPFSIVRYVTVRAGDPDDYEIVKPISAYKRKKKVEQGGFSNPITETRSNKEPLPQFHHKLKAYGIPDFLRDEKRAETVESELMELYLSLEGGEDDEQKSEINCDFPAHLSIKNYSSCLSRLLWIEEMQMEVDIKNYDMVGVPIIREGRTYSLLVPGLAESRPSVLRGDRLTIRLSDSQNRRFLATVERTTMEKAILRFPTEFANVFLDGIRVDVRFSFSRTLLRTSHQALEAIANGKNVHCEQILFPPDSDSSEANMLAPLNPRPESCDQLTFFNRELNDEQKTAVFGVVQALARPSPYIIFGPPGTGKTVTLVESILQTLFDKGASTSTRILVCAPSNAATDLIVQRLIPHVEVREMIRIIAFTREKKSVPPQVLEYSNYDASNDSFPYPDASIVREMRVVAMTLSSGGKLPNNAILGHFTHVFVDEAGHAIEPEVASCIASVTKLAEPPCVVLAGDPKQLGPIIRSDVCKAFGLDVSLLERLSKRASYSRVSDAREGRYDSRLITKLIRNYRSHPAILRLPNDLFYDGDLEACADAMRRNNLLKWEHLPKPNFPLIFHGCEGEDMREGSSPSWFNPEEASLVKMYVDLLVKGSRQNSCSPGEIGIVTPYHKQVQKIRMLLKAHGHEETKVGSVDEFQGSERRVIIISTVRSSVDFLEFDRKHRLGFVANEKRFNVAITRAQALLIVVGNPFVLEQDDNWRALIEYIFDNGGYVGCAYAKKEDRDSSDAHVEVDQVTKCIGEMKLNEVEAENEFVIVPSHVTSQEGPAWRSEE